MTEAVTAGPRIDPRFARRWIEVQRANGRRRLHILLAVGTVFLTCAAVALSVYTPVWKVRHVRVSVSGGYSVARVRQLTGLGSHSLMIDVNPTKIAARLDAVPALGGAMVSRHWPGTVTVRVGTRQPVALIARSATEWATIDATGRVLGNVATQIPGMPILVGAGAVPAPGLWLPGSLGPAVVPGTAANRTLDLAAESGSTDVPGTLDAALASLQLLPASVKSEIVNVDIGRSGSLSMNVLPTNIAVGSVQVIFGDGSQLNQKLSAMVTLLNQADLSNVTQVDLTVPTRPAVLTAR